MSKVSLSVRIDLQSDAIISSGHSTPGGEDISQRLDAQGKPILPGSTLKGLLRESMTDLLVWEGVQNERLLDSLFGTAGFEVDDSRRLIFSTFHLNKTDDWSVLRTFTALEDGVAKSGSLRVAQCLKSGLAFEGSVLCDHTDELLVTHALTAIKWIGLMRNRGFGRVKVCVGQNAIHRLEQPIGETNCLRYRLRLETPLTEGYLRGAQTDETRTNNVATRKYIPGSAIRGYVVSTLAREDPAWFALHRRELLGDGMRMLNAFPVIADQATIPTPFGFYADKAMKDFYSVLNDNVKPGHKRASIDAFCVIQGNTLSCGAPRLANALRILRHQDKQIFTSQAIAAETIFEGYIMLADPSLAPKIADTLRSQIWLGADRYAGNGLCTVTDLKAGSVPHWFNYSAREAPSQELYMMLLSPMTMIAQGHIVGLDEAQLARKLGVERVAVERCATSITEIHGFNRTWGCETPVLPMYEAGSVFKLRCEPAPTAEAIETIEWDGIGLRRSEGFGSILFLKDYAAIQKAGTLTPDAVERGQEEAVVVRRARSEWLLKHVDDLNYGLSGSLMGNIQALCEQAIAHGGNTEMIKDYFMHREEIIEPRIQKQFMALGEKLRKLWETPLAVLLEISVSEQDDTVVARLQLIVDLFNLSRKGEQKK